MLHSWAISSLLTLSVTYSWYSLYGFRFFGEGRHPNEEPQQQKKVRSNPIVSAYMWDIYNNGINSSDADVVKEIYPISTGVSFNPRLYRNHRRCQLEFHIPNPHQGERLVRAEVRITTKKPKRQNLYFQIYLKADKWIFMDDGKVSNVDLPWISLHVTPIDDIQPGVATFLILTVSPNSQDNTSQQHFFHPVLLLSYLSDHGGSTRMKRSPEPEDFEEKTNRIWGERIFLQEQSEVKKVRSGCRRKPLYIKFSDIDYDSWIVAPSGYEVGFEAFQCAGKCGFPVGDHLSPTKHAILQTLIHDMYPWKASRACCVPTRLDPISILYVDDNGVLTYRFRYRDMVVAECGCR